MQQPDRNITAATHNSRRIVAHVFCAVPAVSRKVSDYFSQNFLFMFLIESEEE
jgi:hypothetical protein